MLLQSLLLGLHLICVNLAAAGPLLCPLVQWRSISQNDALLARIGQRLAVASLGAFVLGGILGLLNGLLWWNAGPERLAAAMDRLSSKIYFGIWELAFFALCMVVYIAWWKVSPPRSVTARVLHSLFAFAAATNLLWHFPPLMTILVDIAANAPVGQHISAGEFRQLMFSTTILPRCVHVWLASVAVGGISLAVLAARTTITSPEVKRCIATGGRIALAATLLQALVGAWLLFTSPVVEQARFMGGNWLATLLLTISIVAALWLMHALANIALNAAEAKQITTAALVMTLVIFIMSATLILARGDVLRAPIESRRTPTKPPSASISAPPRFVSN